MDWKAFKEAILTVIISILIACFFVAMVIFLFAINPLAFPVFLLVIGLTGLVLFTYMINKSRNRLKGKVNG